MIIPELRDELRRLGINTGDVLCVSSDVSAFGIPQEVKEAVSKNGLKFLLDSYIETFIDVVGDKGAVLMPTFTYSACRNELYDVRNSPSTVGVLTEHFRKYRGVTRSLHPIFSYAGIGRKWDELITVSNYDCYGKGSLFDKLYQGNSLMVMFGIRFIKGLTFTYYIEQKSKIDYRYFKDFNSQIINYDNQILEKKIPYFVRSEEVKYIDQWEKLERDSIFEGITKEGSYNFAPILVSEAGLLADLGQKKLKQNKSYLIQLEMCNS